MRRCGLLVSLWLVGCPMAPGRELDSGPAPDAGPETCRPCVQSSDCGPLGFCIQAAGSDYCAPDCSSGGCGVGGTCSYATTESGAQVLACVPSSGCGGLGCPPQCPTGTSCNLTTGTCQPDVPDASVADAGWCGSQRGPAVPSLCHSCVADAGGCQANGCYGGWWCDEASVRCVRAPTVCDGVDAGTLVDGGSVGTGDGGFVIDGGLVTIGPNGGTVSRLYFAVVGDTRPPFIDDTNNYPTGVITGIYQAIEAMQPRPPFVVTTGDYLFARTTGSQGAAQLAKYAGARATYGGVVFPAFGNHECTGATAGNCGNGVTTANVTAYREALLVPLGKTELYYAFDVNDVAAGWTAKFLMTACNAWDATQQAWLAQQLARTTTFTFVIRHEALGVAAPCTTAMDAMLRASPPTMMIVGHTHTFSHIGNQLVEGVGGAPITGNAVYGFATVEQMDGGFRVTQYDSARRAAVATFSVP